MIPPILCDVLPDAEHQEPNADVALPDPLCPQPHAPTPVWLVTTDDQCTRATEQAQLQTEWVIVQVGAGQPRTRGLPRGTALLVVTEVPHDLHMAVHALEDQPEDTEHLVVHQRGGLAWLREHVTALQSWASTIAGAEVRLHDHPAVRPGDTRALSMDQLTPSHPDVRWHSADLNAGWLSPTGYYRIPEVWGHTSSDASGGGPCRHATSVALAADLTGTWAVAISGTVPNGEGVAASLPLQYGAHRPWVHTVDAEVIRHLLRHADCERATGVPAGAAKVVNQMPLRWLRDGLRARGQHAEHPSWYARATSHHSDTLLHKAEWPLSQDTVLQNHFLSVYFFRVICMHGAELRDAYKVKKDGKDSYEFRTSSHQTMPYVALLLNTSSFDGCRYEDINFKFEPFRFAAKHTYLTVRDLRLHKTLRFEVSIEFLYHIEPSPPERDKSQPKQRKIGDAVAFMKLMNEMFVPALANVSVNTENAYYPFGHIVPSESPHWAYYRFDWELPSRFADELMFKVRECAQFLTGELLAVHMHALPTTEVYRAVIARDRKEENKDLQAPEMLTMMIANLPRGRGASSPLGAMFRSEVSLVVVIDSTHAPCDVMKTGVKTLAIRFFHSCGIVLFHGIDGQLVPFLSRSDGNTRSAPSSAPKRAHATPAPHSYNSSIPPKTAVLLVAPRSAHAIDLRVQAGFLGPYVSFKPTRPPYERQQAHLVVYEKEESALLAHDFKCGDAAFAPLHRNLPALEKILPAQDPDVAEHEQPIVQRLQAGAALGSTTFVSQLVSALRDRPATGLTECISEWKAAPDDADASTPTPGPNRIEQMSETGVPLLAPLGGEATTLLPPNHDAPTPASEIQIDPRLPTGFYYVRSVFSESQEETVKKVLHDNTWDKYHGRSVQHFGHAYLGPSKVTATSSIPD